MGCFANARELQSLAATLRSLAARDTPGLGVYVGEAASARALREVSGDLDLPLDFEWELADATADLPPVARLARTMEALAPCIARESPDLLLVHGASPGAAGAAVAGRAAGLVVGHVTSVAASGRDAAALGELIAQLAGLHFHADGAGLAGTRAQGAPLGHSLQVDDDPERAGQQVADAVLRLFAKPTRPLDARGAALEDFVTRALAGIVEISPEAALRLLEAPGQKGWHFLDVREPDEYAESHLPGARNSPRGFLEVRADLCHYKRDPWFEDRGRKLILYCGGGHRSALATHTLVEMGFENVRSLAEGYTGWLERGYPVEPGSG